MTVKIMLETERLVLGSWTETAVDELHAMHADPDVARYLDVNGKGWSREKAALRLAGWQDEYRRDGLGKHRLTRKSDGAFIGRAGFSLFGSNGAEIGYSLARHYWGNGYASEIAEALGSWFFATRQDPHFIGFAHRDNAASRRILEKIGMRPTHEGLVAEMPHQFYLKGRPSNDR
jgi:[ribosomal protein S5]-alanine N-acetyltransferase